MAESDNAQLRCLEERLLQHTTRRSSERLRELLAEDFVELGSSGRIFNREEIIAALRSEAPGKRELSNFKTKVLADGLVLVTYRSSRTFPTGLEANGTPELNLETSRGEVADDLPSRNSSR